MSNPDDLIRRGWSKEQVKAALRDAGYSLAALSRLHGYGRNYFSLTLIQPMRKGEKIIADILGVHPSEIWPARYGSDGHSLQARFLPENDGRAQEAARQSLKDVS